MHPYEFEMVAAERRREVRAEAARLRMIASAACCRERAVTRLIARLRSVWAALTVDRGTACCSAA
ncbi:hypothetical protein G1H11_05660 [Phytoactinopolyspora alkaliphila]|uniref:Uncharacterized protein n=1 Tax=Phytoactinopolyspora alkaliphila TaxID=1783498 RepID=A0A6N9YIH0_9ACTN|nr:hypothetical protein [Phytoactinopolyspora alkaliphila]NED94793.1 hypothetical protein [Phytoactinopolyspora alkaliphila]